MSKYDNTNLQRELLVGVPLNDRDIRLLRYIAKGMSATEIGKRMHLSPETVKSYKKEAIYKLDAKNGANAVAIAIALGVVNVDEFVNVE